MPTISALIAKATERKSNKCEYSESNGYRKFGEERKGQCQRPSSTITETIWYYTLILDWFELVVTTLYFSPLLNMKLLR